MKSEKAKEFLRTRQPGDIAQYEVSLWKAERAVEIAEEELFEKAVKLFYEDCEGYRGNGTCASGLKCEDCEAVKIYKQKLMER